ncbi:MAG: hypothetical protein JXC33_02340 [Deltaproteobacteria bacterium]|nr:hypothetical protein [Deltaproteobacteria bacterium]
MFTRVSNRIFQDGLSSLSVAHSGENVDMTRVLGQVVTGIGFLGAGVIIAREGLVRGITSADAHSDNNYIDTNNK